MERSKIYAGPVWSKIVGPPDIREKVDKALSFEIKGAKYSPRMRFLIQSGRWDGRQHIFNKKTGLFPTGLLKTVQLIADAELTDKRFLPDEYPQIYNRLTNLKLNGIELSEPQRKAIFLGIEKKRGKFLMATNSGKCIASGQLVAMADGSYKKIEDICPGEEVISYDFHNNNFVAKKVLAKKNNGIKKCYNSISKFGRSIITTDNHRFLVGYNKWQDIGTINEDQMIGMPLKMSFFGDIHIDPSIARMLGFYLGDGNGTRINFLRFSCGDEKKGRLLAKDIANLGDELVRDTKYDYRVRRSNGHKVTNSIELLKKYNVMGLGSWTKFVPLEVYHWDKSSIQEFLKSYLGCDGCITKDGVFTYTSVSKNLMYGVARLLLKFGVTGRIRLRKIKYKYKGIVTYRSAYQFDSKNRATIDNLKDIVPYGKELQYQRIYNIFPKHDSFHDRMPIFTKDISGIKRKDRLNKEAGRHISRNKLRSLSEIYNVEQGSKLSNADINWIKLKDKEFVGECDTWDLQIQDTSNFICEDFIVHNSEICIGLAEVIQKKAIWLVHRKDLLYQCAERYELRTGKKAGIWGDGQTTVGETVTIAMVQSIPSKTKAGKEFLKQFEVLLVDECNHSQSNTWYSLCLSCPATYRFGLSGKLSEDDGKIMRINAVTDEEIIFQTTNEEMIDSGWSAKPYIHIQPLIYPDNAFDYKTAYNEMIRFSKKYASIVADEAARWFEDGKSVLIIVDRMAQGININAELSGRNVPAQFLNGQQEGAYRTGVIDKFRKGKIPVVIATSILDEGVDVPAIQVLILAAGGKSAPRQLQRVGRALRKKIGDNRVEIVDYIHNGNYYLLDHSLGRVDLYTKEGFELIWREPIAARTNHV